MGKYALITGASGGIGKAIALTLAREGFNLYLHYNNNLKAINELLNKLQEYGGEYIPINADLTDPQGYKLLAEGVFSLDAVIHGSGSSHYGLLMDLEPGEAQKIIQLHVTSPLMLTRELLPKLISKRSGSIIVISSIWGQTGGACEVAYSAAKGAQIAFVKALSKEVALNGVRVNAVAPGAVKTAMMEQFDEEELSSITEEIPMGRLGLPEEIAEGVKFLVSPHSSYITGQVIGINGGWYT